MSNLNFGVSFITFNQFVWKILNKIYLIFGNCHFYDKQLVLPYREKNLSEKRRFLYYYYWLLYEIFSCLHHKMTKIGSINKPSVRLYEQSWIKSSKLVHLQWTEMFWKNTMYIYISFGCYRGYKYSWLSLIRISTIRIFLYFEQIQSHRWF